MRTPIFALALSLLFTPLYGQDAPAWPILKPATDTKPLPGTVLLEDKDDLSRKLVETNDRFLDREIERAAKEREKFWKRDFSSPEAYVKSVQPNRERLARMLGVDREVRPAAQSNRLQILESNHGKRVGYTVNDVSWRAFGNVNGDGELYRPDGAVIADVIFIPEADDRASEFPFAATLARSGCRVLIVRLVDREMNEFQLSQREWIQRSALLLGRTLTGYEVIKVQAAIDCLLNDRKSTRPLGIAGYGEGGRIALFAAALETRIDTALVSGAFGPREALWKEPADHNVFGFLREFGDAELASLITPRPILFELGSSLEYRYRAEADLVLDTENRAKLPGKPGLFTAPTNEEAMGEVHRLQSLAPNTKSSQVISPDALSKEALVEFATSLGITASAPSTTIAEFLSPNPNRVEELVLHNRLALIEAAADRARYFADLKTDSLENFEATIEPYREKFRTEVIGDFELPLLPPNARTRPCQISDRTLSYEVVLDVMESGGEKVFAYGILTLPKDLDLGSGEKRPVVVCQHGLEGSPWDVIGEQKHEAYSAFATRLAEEGFITFAPQNGYKYFDLFRMQQFKAQSISKTLFSIIVPQHRQITDWLAAQPFVDPDKIAFYGLSYGGKSAMRIPPLVDRYCLSICSADFNEWVWKNAATDEASLRYSYANKGEYEIFEWNLGGTFNYAEMAALICPRPFMVERGHFDGVGPDEQVAFEFAKVKRLYEAQLGLKDRCEIEWFAGPHKINGVGTFEFLKRHLGWPPR